MLQFVMSLGMEWYLILIVIVAVGYIVWDHLRFIGKLRALEDEYRRRQHK
jgi:hypothetical protein